MAEAIHCPSCSTRYRLRPERLKPVIRRAKCFTCGGLFPVGDVVQRLLALTEPSDTSRFMIEDLEAAQHLADLEAAPPTLTPGDLDGMDAESLEKTLVGLPLSLPETKVEVAFEAAAPVVPPEPLAEPMPEPWPEPWPELIPIARAYLAAAPDRVVWGSEWPQSMLPFFKTPIPDLALLLDLLLDYTSDEAMIERILVDNPASLYDFPAVS